MPDASPAAMATSAAASVVASTSRWLAAMYPETTRAMAPAVSTTPSAMK